MKQHLYSNPARSKGLALVELMIAMTLGLVLIGAATGVMLSNSQSFRATQSISKVQESARLGFELMARDIRQAGAIPCGSKTPVENLLTDKTHWYMNWDGNAKGQLIGYQSATPKSATPISNITNQVENTEGLTVMYASNEGASISSMPTNEKKQTYIIEASLGRFETGDIAVICNQNFASIFHADVSPNDENSIKIMALNSNTSQNPGLFKKNAVIGKLKSRVWYIGTNKNNEEQKKSLYLAEWTGSELTEIEIATGVSNLSFQYRLKNTADFKDTKDMAANQWPLVNAVAVTLEFEDQNTMSDDQRIKRSFTSIVALRNRI